MDWAIENGISYGGWCPSGRRAENGTIPDHYILQETESKGYMQRTKWNVRDSDATLIISLLPELTGGSLFTQKYAHKIGKPCLHVYPDSHWQGKIKIYFETNEVKILNIAGPRDSSSPNIEQFVYLVLEETLLVLS